MILQSSYYYDLKSCVIVVSQDTEANTKPVNVFRQLKQSCLFSPIKSCFEIWTKERTCTGKKDYPLRFQDQNILKERFDGLDPSDTIHGIEKDFQKLLPLIKS